MVDLNLPKFDSTRDQIKNMKQKGQGWEKIESTYELLKDIGTLGEDITEEIWTELVKETAHEYEHQKDIEKSEGETTIISDNEDNASTVPGSPRSSWQLYREKLLNKGWRKEAVDNLEDNTLKLLKKLNRNTAKSGPNKGLVIGQVQSGKTASMAGLMAMAADWGWNTFIILSGMIENLREQTQARLISDLNSPGNLNWRSLHKLSRHSEIGDRAQQLNFNEGSSQRYLNVCLKNKTRLENLLGWLKADSNKLRQMKVLVIDDEADQGSVNTKNLDKDERTKINDLIIKLVEVNVNGEQPKSVNYISYTATPYSNFLNESHPESLYPKDFIGVLPVADEHFGPKQIFGGEETEESDRLDIVRRISEEDRDEVINLQEGHIYSLPDSFVESIVWFFNSTAVMRFYDYKKPVSMLVHTSQRQAHHTRVAESISNWIKNTSNQKLLELCESLYEKENERFTIRRFREGFPEYPVPDEKLRDYPDFKQIKKYILKLKNTISHIKMDESGDLDYHNGVHLCIDNSANSGISDENVHIRLAYPNDEKLSQLDKAPAFIIVGGSTLSRGLTIEGLVSTYFLRAATAADSLMQMGRWFGFRKGYELLPRIWMTENTFEQFQFLTTLEEELREELKQFQIGHKSPSQYGPRVKNSPKVSWLRVTAKNKMQDALEVDMDFSGASIQTIHFDNEPKILENNIKTTSEFLKYYCGTPVESKVSNSVVYRGIDFESIKNQFLLKMCFNDRSRVFNQINAFCDWYEKVKDEIGFDKWNVIVPSAGRITESGKVEEGKWKLGPYTLGTVNRSAKKSSMNYNKNIANIGVLRGPNDLYADIDDPDFNKVGNKGSTNEKIEEERRKYGLGNVPQLIIYRINKNSKARVSKNESAAQNRIDLKEFNFKHDLIGVYINVPGDTNSGSYAKALTVNADKLEGTEE